jgi:hypothetical protein
MEMAPIQKPPEGGLGVLVPSSIERASAFEIAARAGWEHRRSKWTQPEWDRLDLNTRLVIVSKTEAAINAYLAAKAEGKQ